MVRWRPSYTDDYFDAGKDVTTRAIRLRVVEPRVNEDQDIASTTGGKPNMARRAGWSSSSTWTATRRPRRPPPSASAWWISPAGSWERNLPVPAPQFPHFDGQGNLVVVTGTQVARVSLADGALTPIITSGLEEPKGIAFDAQGNLYVADAGRRS